MIFARLRNDLFEQGDTVPIVDENNEESYLPENERRELFVAEQPERLNGQFFNLLLVRGDKTYLANSIDFDYFDTPEMLAILNSYPEVETENV